MGTGILPSIAAIEPRVRLGGQIAHHRVIALVLVCGCDQVEGGAVELSWKLRPASSQMPDKFVECRTTVKLKRPGEVEPVDVTLAIDKMRLEWTVQTDDNRFITGTDAWSCDDSHGVTGFDLPAGTALLSLKPICREFDAAANSYIAPTAEQRRVNLGETISLGAVEIVVTVDDCDNQSCICE